MFLGHLSAITGTPMSVNDDSAKSVLRVCHFSLCYATFFDCWRYLRESVSTDHCDTLRLLTTDDIFLIESKDSSMHIFQIFLFSIYNERHINISTSFSPAQHVEREVTKSKINHNSRCLYFCRSSICQILFTYDSTSTVRVLSTSHRIMCLETWSSRSKQKDPKPTDIQRVPSIYNFMLCFFSALVCRILLFMSTDDFRCFSQLADHVIRRLSSSRSTLTRWSLFGFHYITIQGGRLALTLLRFLNSLFSLFFRQILCTQMYFALSIVLWRRRVQNRH